MFILKTIYNFLQEISRKRAAPQIGRRGYYLSAQKSILEDFKNWI